MKTRRLNYLVLWSIIGLALIGCTQGGSENADLSGGMKDGAGLRNVTGTNKIMYVSASGFTERARDLSTYKISALIQNGLGSFAEIIGAGKADGSFSIPDVPSGAYWLRSQPMGAKPLFLFTTATQVDLGSATGDRADEVIAAATGTKLAVKLSGLFPWQPDCLLETYVPTLLQWFSWFGPDDSSIMNGDTTWSSTIDLSSQLPLIEGGKGDTLYFLQLCADPMANNTQTLRRIYQTPPFTMAEGMTSTVMGAMTDVPLDRELSGRWQRSAFLAHADAISKQPTPMQPPSLNFGLSVLPNPGAQGFITATADLFLTNSDGGTTDLDLAVSYGDPFPSAWSSVYSASILIPIQFLAPGAKTPTNLNWGGMMAGSDLTQSGALAPRVSPIRQLQVGGKDAQSPQSHVGLNPTVTWATPQTGTASGYQIRVGLLDSPDGMTSQLRPIATLFTTQLSATLPPGVLQSGQAYVLVVTAISRGRMDFASAPLRSSFPEGSADAVSAILQVD